MEAEQSLRLPLICRICGDVARGKNFDVVTCMSCKAFFRRNALLPIAAARRCPRKFNCRVTKETRAVCSACRLKRCFAFGMKPQLIRSISQHKLPTPQPLGLLQNDRSTLTSEQWNLLSNIVHIYDDQNFVNIMKCSLNEGSTLPIKLRTKPSFAFSCIQSCFASVELLIKRSSHFQSLSRDARRIVIKHNSLWISSFNGLLIARKVNYLSDPNFVMSFSRMGGSNSLEKVIRIIGGVYHTETILKLMMFIVAFLSNGSIVTHNSLHDIETRPVEIDLICIQDIYVTVLWKYLIYRYGFVEAVHNYSSLIKIILDLFRIHEEMNRIEVYEKIIDTTVKQIEELLT